MEKYLNSYNKLSDKVFIEPNAEHKCSGFVLSCGDTDRSIASFWSESDAINAANAINSHDELVAMNKELLDALEKISRLPSHRQDECSEMAREAIAKAKGTA